MVVERRDQRLTREGAIVFFKRRVEQLDRAGELISAGEAVGDVSDQELALHRRQKRAVVMALHRFPGSVVAAVLAAVLDTERAAYVDAAAHSSGTGFAPLLLCFGARRRRPIKGAS